MLNRLLLVLDVLLLAAAGALGVELHRIWTEAPPAAAAPSPPAAAGPEPAAPAPAAKPPAASPAVYAVIAERNLFSPTRAEVAPDPAKSATPVTAAAAPTPPARPVERPRLYGVVLGADGGPRAYLWDPQTKKVFGYKVGDAVAESRLEQINGDRVVLRRGGEVFEVLLHDPSKPRAAAPPPPAAAIPGQPVPGQFPGQLPGQFPGQLPGQPAAPFGLPVAPPAGESAPPAAASGAPGSPSVPGSSTNAPRPFPLRTPRTPTFPATPGARPGGSPSQATGDSGS